MASPAYEQILAVQALDLDLGRLRHQIETHPQRATLSAATAALAELDERMAGLDGQRHELDRRLTRLSDETSTIENKRTSTDAKLYDGSVTAAKELLALQDEVASLRERQRSIEDDQLVVMEEIEVLDAEIATVGDERRVAEEARAAADAALASAVDELEREVAATERARSEAATPAPPELLARYEQLARQFGGVAVARFADGRCDGCHMQLSAVAVDRLAKAPDDAVVTCEECGRLLVR